MVQKTTHKKSPKVQDKQSQKRRPLLSQEDVREFLGLTKRQMWDLHITGKGPKYYWINQNTKRYDPDEFDAWLKSRECIHSSQEYLIKEQIKQVMEGTPKDAPTA